MGTLKDVILDELARAYEQTGAARGAHARYQDASSDVRKEVESELAAALFEFGVAIGLERASEEERRNYHRVMPAQAVDMFGEIKRRVAAKKAGMVQGGRGQESGNEKKTDS